MLKVKKFKTLVLSFIVIFIAAILYHFFHSPSKPQKNAEHPVVVSTITIKNQQWQSVIQAIGNVKASKSIEISSEVAGLVTGISFDSGQAVTQGQILVHLRADNIQASLEKAQAVLQEDTKNYQRRKTLLSTHFISAADVDDAKAKVESDQADVKEQQAFLEQRIIKAPFTGIVGIREVELGQYLAEGQSIVDLESIDPVYVDFSIPEKWISRIKIGEAVDVLSDAYPGQVFTGTITATANAIDINNRSYSVRVAIANPQKKLLSGMSVNVTVKEPSQNKIIVPQAALAYNPDGVGIYVLDKDKKVHWHTVTVGERQENQAVILSGLKSDDTIVIAGQQKLQDGALVTVNNEDLLAG